MLVSREAGGLGVKASGSHGLGETVVRGRSFNMLSTSHRKVAKLSSLIVCVPQKHLEDFAYGAYTTFPHASEIRAIWRIEDPFAFLLQKTFLDLVMIP